MNTNEPWYMPEQVPNSDRHKLIMLLDLVGFKPSDDTRHRWAYGQQLGIMHIPDTDVSDINVCICSSSENFLPLDQKVSYRYLMSELEKKAKELYGQKL